MIDCIIWVVDDDPDDLSMIEQAFSECFFKVRTFNSNENYKLVPALLQTEDSDLPQLILLDINMPIISGKQILADIKENPRLRHIPVTMFTTSNSRKEKLECFDLGANCFLTKPSHYSSMVKICSALSTVFCTPDLQSRKSYLSTP